MTDAERAARLFDLQKPRPLPVEEVALRAMSAIGFALCGFLGGYYLAPILHALGIKP